jgi:transposase
VLADFAADFQRHGGAPERIKEVSCDMSAAYIRGVGEQLPAAAVTFDKFHLVGVVNKALDEVRRCEQGLLGRRSGLSKSKYLWLRNPARLSHEKRQRLEALRLEERHQQTALAYQIKLAFQDIYEEPAGRAEAALEEWCAWAERCGLEPMARAAGTMRRHWDGILRWFTSRLTNGLVEGINGLIQAAKNRARGYRSTDNLITMIYLADGRRPPLLPT